MDVVFDQSSNHFKALFRKIQAYNPKDPLDGKRFGDIKVIHAINCYFEVKDKSYRRHEKLEHRWTKCIEFKRDYFEK